MTSTEKNGSASQRQGPSALDMQQILEVGRAASETLNSPVYNLVHRQAVDEIIQQWATTEPKETAKREDLWKEFQCLAKAAMRMQSHVENAHRVLEQQNSEQERQEADYLDRQGFGFGPDQPVGDGQYQ